MFSTVGLLSFLGTLGLLGIAVLTGFLSVPVALLGGVLVGCLWMVIQH